jgi:capsular polysaccharide transport system permease protein
MCVLWCLAMGFGLITSVVTELIPELGEVLSLVMMPLFFLSGVIFPVGAVPMPYREWMLFNPIVHSVEGMRLGFASHYQPVSELDLWYPAATAFVMIFLGLLLHRRFATRLIAL